MTEQGPTQCPLCQSAVKLVPAGISKRTGRPYQEFYSCINRDCDYTYRPPKRGNPKMAGVAEGDQGEKIIQALRQIYAEIELLKAGNIKIIKQLEELEKRSVIYPDKNEKEL